MSPSFTEGQFVLPSYRLISSVASAHGPECWLAFDESTNERVFIRFIEWLEDTAFQRLERDLAVAQGLVHNNIVRVLLCTRTEEHTLLVEQCVWEPQPFAPSSEAASANWQTLSQLIEAVQYAHSLGIAHGRLHPGNVLLDNTGRVKITGFGLAAIDSASTASVEPTQASFLSAAARAGHAPDMADDVHSIGCFAHWCLTGTPFVQGQPADTPMPRELEPLVRQMLSETMDARRVRLDDLRASLKTHYERGEAIGSVAFNRSSSKGTSAETSASVSASVDDQPASQPHRARQASYWPVLATAAVVLSAAALLFQFLPNGSVPPETITPRQSQPASAPRQVDPGPSPFQAAQLERMRDESTRLAREILRKQIEVEDMGGYIWAGEEMTAVQALIDTGENHYQEGDFSAALEQYQSAIAQLDALADLAPEVLARESAKGEAALKAGDAEVALTAFTIAAAIDPDDETFTAGIRRAENLGEVKRLVSEAGLAEQAGELNQARELLARAQTLDPAWQPAIAGVARVDEAIRQRNFRDAMSEGFRELAANNYAGARASFEKASRTLPDSTEPMDGLLQVEQAERGERIRAHRQAATAHMESEQWEDALAEYQQALALDPSLVFAASGVEQAEKFINISRRVAEYVDDSSLLQDDEELADARRLLVQASGAGIQSESVRANIDTLAHLVTAARIKIPLTLVSDNQTSLQVLKVANLGRIQRRTLELTPGRYTIVGRRKGYRDARQIVTIAPGSAAATIRLVCDEPL